MNATERDHRAMTAPEIKRAAAGRWPEILERLGGLSSEILDGRNHPCPKCGGQNRFAVFKDFSETGGMNCRKCHNENNGDGFAALQWLTGCTFPEAVGKVAEHLGRGKKGSADGLNLIEKSRTSEAVGRASKKSKAPAATFATAADAVADLERSMGKRSALWTYHNAAGEPVGVVVRWDKPDGEKDIRPVSRNGKGWFIGGMPEPRPLYGLPELADAKRAFVTEGEKAADAARSIGLTATTSPHGSQSADKADWSTLAGREVVLLPDNDAAGETYAADVAAILRKLKPRPTVKTVRLPGLPEAGDIADWLEARDAAEPEQLRAEVERLADAAPSDLPAFAKLITSGELLALDIRPKFLVRGVMVAGQPLVVGGRSKTLKTSIVCDLALSLGSGTPFLGRFESERANVGFWSGESGAAVLRETAKRQAASKGIDLAACSVFWSFDLPKLSQAEHLETLRAVVDKHGLRVVIVDPLYLSLLNAATAGSASNIFAMGAALQAITQLAQEAGITLAVLHHFRKGGQRDDADPAGLEELAQSGAAEWARQWLLLQRRSPYAADGRHELWMRCGGSAGHASLWAVDIDEGELDHEGNGGRKWEVSVNAAADARHEARKAADARRAEEIERREGEQRDRVLSALRSYPTGETARTLRLHAGLNPAAFDRAMFSLQRDGKAQSCTIEKSGRKYDGFEPTGK